MVATMTKSPDKAFSRVEVITAVHHEGGPETLFSGAPKNGGGPKQRRALIPTGGKLQWLVNFNKSSHRSTMASAANFLAFCSAAVESLSRSALSDINWSKAADMARLS